MSTKGKMMKDDQSVHSAYLSSNHKVIHYLQNSTKSSKSNSVMVIHDVLPQTNDSFHQDETGNPSLSIRKDRSQSCLDSFPSPLVTDSLSRSGFSLGSSLSDRVGFCSNLSSNTSSSGVCSRFSDVGHEETRSNSSEELDFNLGFEHASDHDDGEIANLHEIDDLDSDEYEQLDDENQPNSNKNSADTATLRDITESNLDVRINELEEFLRKSYDSTDIDNRENNEFDHEETVVSDRNNFRARPPFLHDSTFTLSSQDRFTAYMDDDDQENDQLINGVGIRSNSLRIIPVNTNSVLLDKAPKKVVRFADVLGLDLESIRYMTPPDQSTTSLIQECIRIKLEQLRFARNHSITSKANGCSDLLNQCSSPLKGNVHQQYLVSKYFKSPISNIQLVYQRQIMLECLYTKDTVAYGTARVHNIAYNKRVFARVTENQWETFHDVQAWHSMNYPNDNTDTFTFEIRLGNYNNQSKLPKDIYFAVCLQTDSCEFWDNNQGWNYVLTVLERR